MIAPIEVSPSSSPGLVKVCRVSQGARKQLVFLLTTDRGEPLDLQQEVVTDPAPTPSVHPVANPAQARVRLRTSTNSSELSGNYSLDIPGTILPETGYVSFQLLNEHTTCAGIWEGKIERYLDDGALGILLDTWPVLLAIEPTSLALLDNPSGPLLIPEIRLALLDVHTQNGGAPFSNLLDDTEFTDLDLIMAQRRVVQLWNETPPAIGSFTIRNFPYRYWWLQGTTALLLQTAAARYRRNQLEYSAGGVAINDQAKSAEYEQLAQTLMGQFREWMMSEKLRINMDRCWSIGI